MTAITDKANLEYRDMEAPGSTVPNEPEKLGIRELFALIDVALASLGVNGAITVKKATQALLFADLAHDADTLAVVYNDATSAYNGIYAKVGGSGSGSWSLTALALPSSFGADLAEALAAQEAASAAAASATASAAAATAGGAAAVSSAAAAAASAAEAADDAATAAALAGVQRIFNTKALANAGIGSITADAHIIVMVDESQNDRKTLYQKVSGAYVFVVDLDTFSNPIVNGDLTLTDGAVIVPDTLPIRIGTDAMPSLGTDGTYNYPGASIAIGLKAGFSNVEGGVTAVGWEAGYAAGAVGDESAITAMGWKALRLTTTGHATAFGWAAGQFNTTGDIATFGDESSGQNTTGTTAALGYYAAFGNVTGLVTAVGYQAGRFAGPATNQTLMGHNAGLYATGATLTAVGHAAASDSGNSGVANSAFGHQALFSNTTGSSNTASGLNSLFGNTTGFENTVMGSNAGRSIVSGYQNTFIGSEAGFNGSQKADAINSIAVGYGAFTVYDNSTVIGTSATSRFCAYGYMGANGQSDPQYPLDVLALSTAGTAANIRNLSGFGFQLQINDGVDTLGYGANYRHAIEYGSGESLAITEASTVRAVVQASTGNFGIGTTAPEYALDVAGAIGFTPGASVTPAQNGDVVFELTSNTSLTIKAKGSDGTVRSVVLTLA
jgi:hypothetical protein